MSHYFTNDFHSHETTEVVGFILGVKYTLKAGPGVFSYKNFDAGTVLMLENMSISHGTKVLDLCSGYGLVGSFIAKNFPDCECRLVDVSERACHFARHNLSLYGGDPESIICGDAREWLAGQTAVYDTVLLNPPFSVGKEFCFGLVEDSGRVLKTGGALYLVAPTKKGAKSYEKKMQDVFGNVEQLVIDGGYRLYRSIR